MKPAMDSSSPDATLAEVIASAPEGVTRPGGSPHDAPEAKLAGILSDMTYLRRDVDRVAGDLKAISALQTDMATIKETLRHIPTWGQQLGTVALVLGLIGAMTLFGPNLRKAIGLETVAVAASAPLAKTQ